MAIYLASSMGRSTLFTITGSSDILLSSPCDASSCKALFVEIGIALRYRGTLQVQ